MSREIFSFAATVRASEDVARQIKTAIVAEEFKAGDRLSSEMELARIFHTSRTTVREALRALENEGFLEVRQGVKGGPTFWRPILLRLSIP
jgi:DNA-binding FadR family transcriptional regulator